MNDVPANDSHRDLPKQSAAKKVAVVQCEGFRCLAYRDPDTEVWRDVETGAELSGVQSIVFEFAV
jgi:hypothetical protein